MSTRRWADNPILSPEDIRPLSDQTEVIGVFNAGVTRIGREVVLLLRVAERVKNPDPNTSLAAVYDLARHEITSLAFDGQDPDCDVTDPRLISLPTERYLTSVSTLRLARSRDGIHFTVDDRAGLLPQTPYETFGLEDPRITFIDGLWYIDYVAVSPRGITTALVSTTDFERFHRHGLLFGPENKDVVLFPERLQGRFFCLHRPTSPFSLKQEVWLADSPDILSWGGHRFLFGPRPGLWDGVKVGPGAVPFCTEQGWLEVYHGVDDNNRYCLGAILLDKDEPWIVRARSKAPILEPTEDYERRGFIGNVVFTCGLLFEEQRLKIYYGAADTTLCYAEIPLEDVFNGLEPV
ncbi:MAG: glycoside hydrolase family 130 protein [Planctomycetes bacterium]|nr:glycoside hydrolase family 130 protein [Planctomycetota bacterium]